MNINEIVGRLKAGGLDASSTNRSAAVYVTEARSGRAEPGWFGFRIVCDSEATERRVRSILSRWYDIEASGNVWRLRSKNRVPLMAIKRGGVPPTPPTPGDYMYFEAAEANSTVSMMSMLATAPNLEYSTDGETWQEWQHTTTTEDEMTTHTFDTLTLTAVGDRVYLRGDNQYMSNISDAESPGVSVFVFQGTVNSGGCLLSLCYPEDWADVETLPEMAELFFCGMEETNPALLTSPSIGNVKHIPDYGCLLMFGGQTKLRNAVDMSKVESVGIMGFSGPESHGMYDSCWSLVEPSDYPSLATIGDKAFQGCYRGCTSLTRAANMPIVDLGENISNIGSLSDIYYGCSFPMSNDGINFNFDINIDWTGAPSGAAEMLAKQIFYNAMGFGYGMLICYAYAQSDVVVSTESQDYINGWSMITRGEYFVFIQVKTEASASISLNYRENIVPLTFDKWQEKSNGIWSDFSTSNPVATTVSVDSVDFYRAVAH